jgi:hypothetical protein
LPQVVFWLRASDASPGEHQLRFSHLSVSINLRHPFATFSRRLCADDLDRDRPACTALKEAPIAGLTSCRETVIIQTYI